MDQREQQLYTRSQLTVGILTAFCGLLLAVALLSVSVGVSYGRYMTTGTTAVSFQATPKPCAEIETALETTEESTVISIICEVTCDNTREGASMNIRIYGLHETDEVPPALTVRTADNIAYTVAARELDASTPACTELGARWVYIITDETGNEISFPAKTDGLTLTVQPAGGVADVSNFVFRAEAVKES